MSVQDLADGGPSGTRLGKTAATLVGFYGATPAIQPAATAQSALSTAALTTITDIVTTASVTGAFNALVARVEASNTLVNRMRADLVTLGLIKGSV
jgi:hypothetical protein